jgi:hypothetical protein
MKKETTFPELNIDRSVFRKSHEEKVALKDMKRQFKKDLQNTHGLNWKQHAKPVKL